VEHNRLVEHGGVTALGLGLLLVATERHSDLWSVSGILVYKTRKT
jgi:hypothetical protein